MKAKTCAGSVGAGLVLNGRNECARRVRAGGVSSGACTSSTTGTGVRGVLRYLLEIRCRCAIATGLPLPTKKKSTHARLGEHHTSWGNGVMRNEINHNRRDSNGNPKKTYLEQYTLSHTQSTS